MVLPSILKGTQRGLIVPKFPIFSARKYSTRSSFPSTATTSALTANILYASPFYVPTPMTANLIESNITVAAAAGKLIRLGIYDSDPVTELPRTLLVDGGAKAADPGAPPAIISTVISVPLTPGQLYWFGYVSDGAPTLTGTAVSGQPFGANLATDGNLAAIFRSFTYAALPAAWGTWAGGANVGTTCAHILVTAV